MAKKLAVEPNTILAPSAPPRKKAGRPKKIDDNSAKMCLKCHEKKS
jgi:hypothetical protein